MKRFYKFLLPLVAIVAMAMPLSVAAQTTCQIKIVGEDGYGDAWNGGSLAIMQGGTTVATFNAINADDGGMEVGAYDSTTVTVSSASPVSFVWTSGDYDEEVTIWIYDGSGTLVFTVNDPTAGTIYTMNTPCPTCIAPSGLAATVTGSDVDLSWNAGDGSAWELVWGTGSFDPDTVTVNMASVTSNAYSFYSMDDGMYTAYVRTDCGSGDYSAWVSVHFNIGVLIMNMATSGTQTISTCNGIIYDDGGPNGQYSGNCQSTLIITPANAGDWVSISGTSYTEGSYDYLTIYDGAGTTGEVLFCDNTSGVSNSIPFGPFASDAITVSFHSDGSVYYDGFQINVTCVPGPSCLRPSTFEVTDVTPDSVYLAWVDSIGSEWLIAYGPAGFTLGGANTTYENATVNSIEIGNLTSNTNYDFYIMTLCGSDTSMSRMITVHTPCSLIDSIPYSTSFEDASTGSSTTFTFGDPCWTLITDATTYPYVYVSSSSSYAHTGGKGIYWYRTTSTGSYGTYQCLVLPGVDATQFPLNTLQLKFWAKASSTSYHPEFQIGVMTNPNDINTFELLGTVNVEGTTWTQYETMLGAYTGTGRYVAIRSNLPNDYWYAYVDDVSLEAMPECPRPVNIVFDSVSTNEIQIHWTALGDETSWMVTINDSLVTDATDTTYIFTNLDVNTLYTITVAALCSNGDTSDNISASVRTLAGLPISQFPYFCGFEQTDDGNQAADWVLENGTQSNYWTVGNATNNGGSRSLYITDNGTSNSYLTGNTSYVFAYASFQFDAGEYAYSYNWKAQGESSYDFIRAAVVPNTVEFTAGGYCGFNNTSSVPAGGQAIDGAYRLNLQGSWQTQSGTFNIANSGVYKVVFMWRNDGSGGTQPPAAIDNIQIVRNTCPAPRNLTATYVTADTVTITWNAGGTETEWEVSDGTNTTMVSDSTYTFDNLNANTSYTFMVRGACDVDDSSMWATVNVRTSCGLLTQLPFTEDFETTGTTTSSNNNFIPCWAKVNNATSTYYPYVSNSTSYNHTPGGNMGLYWYSTTTTSYGTYRMVVLPGVDTTVIPMNTTKLTFWAKSSSTSYYPVLYVGVMSDQTVDSTFQYCDTINVGNSTQWTKYTVMFNDFTGVGNYVAIRDNTGSSSWYVYVDDITLDVIPACPAVEDIEVVTGPVSAMVKWNVIGNSYTGATVEYKADSADTWTSVTVSGVNYAALTGLESNTTYSLRVTANCGDDDGIAASSYFVTRNFACELIDSTSMVAFSDTIGNGTSTSTYFPSYSFYNYGLTQQIFTPEEIGHVGTISSIAFKMSAVSQQRTYEIYMGHTPNATADEFLNPTDLTLVYNGGAVNLAAGAWSTFNLTTPFNYNGTENLVIFFRDMTGSYVSGNAGYGSESTSGVSRYVYQDASPYTVGSTTGGTTSSFRNNLAISGTAYSCAQQSTCAAPVAMVTDVTSSTATVVWAPGNTETSWNLYYRMASETSWSAPVTVTTTSYTFTGLIGGTPYELKIEGACSESPYVVLDAVTNCATISSLPFTEDFNNWGVGHLPNCWYNTGAYSPGSYSIISSSYNMSGSTGGSVYMYSSSTTTNKSVVILPQLDSTIMANQTQLVFSTFYTSTSYGRPKLEVGVMTNPNDITTFVPVDTVQHSGALSTWETFEVSLASYPDSGLHVAMRTVYDSAYSYFYMDNVTLEMIPTCPRPDNLTASNATTNSVDLAWHERGAATTWIIEYGPAGFELGTGTQVVANSNPFTLTGLTASYQGEYYVKSICSATDTGEFSRMPCGFNTTQVPATLPYNYDFENPAEWANWQISSNHETKTWYRGTDVADGGSYSMYVAASDTGYYSYAFDAVVNATAYRDIDFGPIDSSYTLSFSARAGGTTTARYDALMVFLVDPALPATASTGNITTPWGNVNDLYRIATIYLDTNWQTYEASFDTISGVQRVAFFWFNQNTGASYANIPQPGAVDNIHIDYSSCPRPVNVEITPNSTSAMVTWQAEANANYQVIYREYPGAHPNTFVTANTNQIILTGLTANTQYAVWVRKLCSANDTSLASDGYLFTTTMCDGGTEAHNYTTEATTTTDYGPIGYSNYNYSYVQTIIDSADLASLNGDITAFAFLPTNTEANSYFNNMTVYMSNISETSLTDFIHPDATHVFTKVIDSASFNFTDAEWQIHILDTAFTWDGHSNLLISVKRDNGVYTCCTEFAAHSASGNKMCYAYRDTDPYDLNYSGGTTTSTVADIRLISCGSCSAPSVNVTNITYESATVTAGGNGLSYEFAYGTDLNSLGAIQTSTTGIFNLTGLTPATQYFYQMRQNCVENEVSGWTEGFFTTESLPCMAVSNLTLVGTTFNSVSVSWTANGEETAWEVNVFSTIEDTTVTVMTTAATVSGLVSERLYNISVRPMCGTNHNIEGPWSDTIQATTDQCQPVTNLTVSNIGATMATIGWTAPAGAEHFRVIYGLPNFDQGGELGTYNTESNPFVLTELEANSDYTVRVANVCAENLVSQWTSADFTTVNVGINGVEFDGSLSIYPNPASTMVTLSVSEQMAGSTVNIVDVNGRVVMSEVLNAQTLTMNLSDLAKGAYFVRITGEETTIVRKLIVE